MQMRRQAVSKQKIWSNVMRMVKNEFMPVVNAESVQ